MFLETGVSVSQFDFAQRGRRYIAFALVLAFTHLADALRDLLDPALRAEQV